MSTIRLSGSSSGHYDLTVPAVAGTNSIDLSTLPSKTNLGTSNITHGSNTGDTRFTLNSANQYTLRIQNAGNIAGQIGGGGADDLRFSNAAGFTTMQIKDGSVTTPIQPSFLARHNASSFTHSANSYFPFNNRSIYGGYDVGNNFDTSTYLFTVPVTGTYFFHAYTICATTLSNGQWSIRKNGGAIHDHHISQPSTSWYHHTLTITTQCAANDTIGIYGQTTLNFYGNSWSGFMGYLLG